LTEVGQLKMAMHESEMAFEHPQLALWAPDRRAPSVFFRAVWRRRDRPVAV